MRLCLFILVFYLFALTLFSTSAWAEPAVEIDKIIISDQPAAVPSEAFRTQPDTVLRLPEKRARTLTAAEVLVGTAGVHLLRYGGLEQATAISIRGSAGNQVQLVLDGIPLETAAAVGIGLNDISADSLERISIYKAVAPAELGASAVGGVIDLQSRTIRKGWHQHYSFGLGSFFTATARANVQRGGQDGDFEFGIDYRHTDGDFAYLDDNGTPVNSADDSIVTRQNNTAQIVHPHVKLVRRLSGDAKMEWSNHLFRIDSGVPGLGSFQSTTANRTLTELLGSVSWERHDYFDGKLSIKDLIYYRLIKSQFSDPNGEIGLGAAQDTDDDTLVLGNRLQLRSILSKISTIKATLEYGLENFRPQDFTSATPNGTPSTRQMFTGILEPEFRLLKERLTLTPQIRSINAFYQINDDNPALAGGGTFFSNRTENQIAATLSARYRILPKLTAKADFGRTVRLPRFSEMFGDQGFVLGNPRLTSEKSWQGAAGVSWQTHLAKIFPEVTVESTYFERHVDDLIQFELAGGFARAGNIGKARVRGVESLLVLKLPRYFKWIQTHTYQEAIDEAVNPGNRLVGRPEHELSSTLAFLSGAWSADVKAGYIDNQYLDALNTRKVNNRLLVDANASYLFRDRYRLTVEVKNITDSQVVDAVGFPLPGRSVFGRADVYF